MKIPISVARMLPGSDDIFGEKISVISQWHYNRNDRTKSDITAGKKFPLISRLLTDLIKV